jgi:uncharacterized protein (TIGR00159 family)
MQFDFASLWTWHTLSVVLDVLITWYFIYHLTHLIKGTKAVQLANGIILIMAARVLAGWAQLTTVTFILDQIVSWSVIGIIVIFQPEIRRGLERLGRVSLFSDSENSKREQQEKLVRELDKAIQYMSKRRIGALITLEQKTGLEEYVETGIKLDALVTGELLINIFIPNTPLHDGAVIIKNNRVQVASAHLPLSDNAMIPNFFSPAQMTTFLLSANPNSEADRYAASRLLQFPSADSDRIANDALKNIAAGQKLSDSQYWYLKQIKEPMSDHQDILFSQLFLDNNQPKLTKAAKTLPGTYDADVLDGLATQDGMNETTNNAFELKNDFYTKRVKRNLPKLKGSQATWSYVKSPEYSDLQLVLNTYAKKHMEVLFVIPPINAKWAAYTGLDLGMIQNTVTKLKYQLKSQGFNHVLDLSQDGAQPYFMEDTIHIGWRGWLKMDQTVRPFLKTTKAAPVHYKLNDDFYTTRWQQRSANGLN